MKIPRKDFHAFTTKYPGLTARILTDINVSAAFDPDQKSDDYEVVSIPAKALWDTGATKSAVTSAVVDALNLPPVGAVKIQHAGGSSFAPTYLVNVYLPNHVVLWGTLVSEFTSDGTFDVLVGMDIIACGDFAFTNLGDQSQLSFRIPSCEHVDYVVEAHRIKFAGTARNAPCPCGSKQKFKNCHGRGR